MSPIALSQNQGVHYSEQAMAWLWYLPRRVHRDARNAVPDTAVPTQLFMLHRRKIFEGEQSVDKTKQFLMC